MAQEYVVNPFRFRRGQVLRFVLLLDANLVPQSDGFPLIDINCPFPNWKERQRSQILLGARRRSWSTTVAWVSGIVAAPISKRLCRCCQRNHSYSQNSTDTEYLISGYGLQWRSPLADS